MITFFNNSWFKLSTMFSKLGDFWYTQFIGKARAIAKGLAHISGYLSVADKINNVKANLLNNPELIYAKNITVQKNVSDVIYSSNIEVAISLDLPINIRTIQGVNAKTLIAGIDFSYINGTLFINTKKYNSNTAISDLFFDSLSNTLIFILNGEWQEGYNSENLSIYRGILSVDYIPSGDAEICVANFIKGSDQSVKTFTDVINIASGSTFLNLNNNQSITNIIPIYSEDTDNVISTSLYSAILSDGSTRDLIINPETQLDFSAKLPCIKIDNSNPQALIVTDIDYEELNNYNVIIKGEGTIGLCVDEYNSKIAIRPIVELANGDYFYLSYIAFQNITNAKIDYLFECEENEGTILYDAIGSKQAQLTNIDNIEACRIESLTKEWIKSADLNLENFVEFESETSAQSQYPINFSLPLTIFGKFKYLTPSTYPNNYKPILFKIGDIDITPEYETGNGLLICGFEHRSTGLELHIIKDSQSQYIPIPAPIKIYDGNTHNFNLIINQDLSLSLYIDGEIIIKPDRYLDFNPFSSEFYFTLPSSGDLPLAYSNIGIASFAMDDEAAVYNVKDFNQNKTITYDVMKNYMLLYCNNIATINGYTTLLDESPNKNSLIINGNSICSNKSYGTWIGNIGYGKSNNVFIPRQILDL